eukprot:9254062-Alexandrium_andersonii.AAC.1
MRARCALHPGTKVSKDSRPEDRRDRGLTAIFEMMLARMHVLYRWEGSNPEAAVVAFGLPKSEPLPRTAAAPAAAA